MGRTCTRSLTSNNVPVPFPNLEWFRKSVSYQGPSRWNNLPIVFKKLNGLEEFGAAIKRWYIENFISEGVVDRLSSN